MKRQYGILRAISCFILAAFISGSEVFSAIASAYTEKVYCISDTYYNSSSEAIIMAVSESSLSDYLEKELINCSDTVDVRDFDISADSIFELANLIYNSPLLFHISQFSYSVQGGKILSLMPSYLYTAERYTEMYNSCINEADRLLSGIRDNNKLSDVEKALLIHDRIALLCEYDSENLQNNTLPHESYTMYGVLVNGVAVCQGYAEAYLYLLEEVGIESYLCESSQLYHTWNIVTIDGEEYHVDVTWDDPTNDISGRVLHTNFLRSSDGMYETGHTASDYITTPDCDKYDDYFWQNSSSAFLLAGDEIYYIDETDSYIKKYSDNSTIKSVSDMWMSGPYSYYPGCFARLGSDGKNLFYNSSQSVFELDPLTGETVNIWTPQTENEYFRIYGFKYQDSYLYCDINSSPNFTLTTKKEHQQKKFFISDSLTPSGISIKTLPDKISFDLNEAFSYEGLSVSLNYPNGTSLVLTDGFTVSEGDTSTEGDKTVTVAYRGYLATYKIKVTCSHKNTSLIPAEQSTCIMNGHEAYTKCLVCNKIISGSDEPLPLAGHSYQPEITLSATCTEDGEKTFTCTVCHDSYTEKIEATGHSYKEAVTPPTCTEKGYTTFTCECGDSYKDRFVNETGHSYASVITKPASHLEEGTKTFTCHCGDSYTVKIERNPEHSYESYTELQPFCAHKGIQIFECECGHSYKKEIPETGHKDEDSDGLCDACFETLSEKEITCPHMCHSSGFAGFLWKIINYFNMLFGINSICGCGEAHY